MHLFTAGNYSASSFSQQLLPHWITQSFKANQQLLSYQSVQTVEKYKGEGKKNEDLHFFIYLFKFGRGSLLVRIV